MIFLWFSYDFPIKPTIFSTWNQRGEIPRPKKVDSGSNLGPLIEFSTEVPEKEWTLLQHSTMDVTI
jgi:hypothetical protein